jgi:HD superfamily phosphohydrolase
MAIQSRLIRDSLYGPIELDDNVAALAATPVAQRLRHVRLSNIDSIDMPGISNLSRLEHALGVAHLAGEVGFRVRLTNYDKMVLQASALLHDCAITSFGHLVEEAFQYVGTGFDHEQRLRKIVSDEAPEEIGGVQRQILGGREMGLRGWCRNVTKSVPDMDRLIEDITDHIRGLGRMGRVISGEIDLDNIDNLFRMAFHLGLAVDRESPIRLARAMVALEGSCGDPVFQVSAQHDVEAWQVMRRAVYEHLMPAPRDFIGKTMMIHAAIHAFEQGELTAVDWGLTDDAFIASLLSSKSPEAKETAQRWLVGELWSFLPLVWMAGDRPDYPRMLEFSRALSDQFGRNCFAYAIKDKRDRQLSLKFDDGSVRLFGENPHRWLLGIGSPVMRPFSSRDNKAIFAYTASFFTTQVLEPAVWNPTGSRRPQQPWLI